MAAESAPESAPLLQLTKRELLSPEVIPYLLENGTIFYYKITPPRKLYTVVGGREVDWQLLDVEIANVFAYQNAIYFRVKATIRKAVLSPQGSIETTFVREILYGERINTSGMICVSGNEQVYVYRLCDDPFTESIMINLAEEQLEGLELAMIQSNRVFFYSCESEANSLSIRRLSENAFVIMLPCTTESIPFSRVFRRLDISSPLYFVVNFNTLCALNTDTVEFLPSMALGDWNVYAMHGINNGVLTVEAFHKNCPGESFLLNGDITNLSTEHKSNANNEMKMADSEMRELLERLERVEQRLGTPAFSALAYHNHNLPYSNPPPTPPLPHHTNATTNNALKSLMQKLPGGIIEEIKRGVALKPVCHPESIAHTLHDGIIEEIKRGVALKPTKLPVKKTKGEESEMFILLKKYREQRRGGDKSSDEEEEEPSPSWEED